MSRKTIFFGGIDPYEPETKKYLNHSDVGFLNDATTYFASTPYELPGYQIWSNVDAVAKAWKIRLGLPLGEESLKTRWPFAYIRVGGTAAAHTLNFCDVNTFRGTLYGGWTHDGGGALPNGSNAYMDTDCLYDNVNFSVNNQAFFVDLKTDADGVYSDFGCLPPSNAQMNIYGRVGGNMNTRLGDNGTNSPVSTSDSIGMLLISRLLSTEYKQYKEGSLLATPNTSSNALLAPAFAFKITEAAMNANGSIIQHSPRKRTLFGGSDGLSPTEVAGITTDWRTFETAMNR